jgi:hypothetical protein
MKMYNCRAHREAVHQKIHIKLLGDYAYTPDYSSESTQNMHQLLFQGGIEYPADKPFFGLGMSAPSQLQQQKQA